MRMEPGMGRWFMEGFVEAILEIYRGENERWKAEQDL